MSTALIDLLWFHNVESYIHSAVVNNLLPREFTLQKARIGNITNCVN
jgi:glucan phosphorylase